MELSRLGKNSDLMEVDSRSLVRDLIEDIQMEKKVLIHFDEAQLSENKGVQGRVYFDDQSADFECREVYQN